MNNRAIVLGANYYIGLSIIRCLGSQGIKVTAIDYSREGTYGFASKYLDEALIGPHYKEEPKALVDFLIEYAKKQKYMPILFPSADPYVEFIDNYLVELKKYYLIPQTEKGLYTKVMNKKTLHKIAEDYGVLVPETVRLNEDNFIEKIEDTIKYPCLVKPVDSPSFVSRFRKKLFKVHNKQELEQAIKKATDENLEVIVQRIIPGFDDHMYTFDAYINQENKVTHWMTCQKYRQYPINFGASVYTGQKYTQEIYDLGAKFLEDIGFKGFAEIEFKKDSQTGKYYLIEINARTTNLNSLLSKAGLNMPYIAYRDLIGSPLKPKGITHDTNLVFWYAYEDLLAVKDYIKTKQLTLTEVLRSYFKPKVYAIWDWKDPKPSFVFLNKIMKRILKKVFK
ncbi:carboxylate--amine ligase [Clostridium sp. D2Q-11]|uniref:Carboxylate--amine ligase n=1 Tax=Anaeromonas frigoriresistens TaxID=2683708 RepID=A0A942Z7K8_9FIRM|nr:carboxylate--amine ligase [Anaeromonas frigoriresistens]MBS4538807.1 carboxylate--amine ligase [Anaeromonas frigoriresistens]